jgi:hypothetical protein
MPCRCLTIRMILHAGMRGIPCRPDELPRRLPGSLRRLATEHLPPVINAEELILVAFATMRVAGGGWTVHFSVWAKVVTIST